MMPDSPSSRRPDAPEPVYDFNQLLDSETAYRIFRHLHDEPDYGTATAKAIGNESPESVRNFQRSMYTWRLLEKTAVEDSGHKQYYTVDLESTFNIWYRLVIKQYVAATQGGRDGLIDRFETAAKRHQTNKFKAICTDWITSYLDRKSVSTLRNMLLDDLADAVELHLVQTGLEAGSYRDGLDAVDDELRTLNTILRVAAMTDSDIHAITADAFGDSE